MAKLFKDITIDIGEIKAGSKDNKVEWFFEDLKKDDIASSIDKNGKIQWHVVPSCGCTASIQVTDNSIVALYNDNGNHIGKIDKKITVYFKPDDSSTPIKAKNEKGVEVYNPLLGKTTLFLNATVKK